MVLFDKRVNSSESLKASFVSFPYIESLSYLTIKLFWRGTDELSLNGTLYILWYFNSYIVKCKPVLYLKWTNPGLVMAIRVFVLCTWARPYIFSPRLSKKWIMLSTG